MCIAVILLLLIKRYFPMSRDYRGYCSYWTQTHTLTKDKVYGEQVKEVEIRECHIYLFY